MDCAKIGRRAFLEAEHFMVKVRAAAMANIGHSGSISSIVELIRDLDDDTTELQREMSNIKNCADDCTAAADQLNQGIRHWDNFIVDLEGSIADARCKYPRSVFVDPCLCFTVC